MPSAVELLENPRKREKSTLTKIGPTVIGAVIGLGSCSFYNTMKRRPIKSGLPNYLIVTALSIFLCTQFENLRMKYRIQNDAVLLKYIHLHPEDFVEPEPKKYSEIFGTWNPVR